MGYKTIVQLLITSGADIELKDDQGFSSLDIAKQQGHQAVIDLLRRHKEKIK
jgi:ankyrin repeat protein